MENEIATHVCVVCRALWRLNDPDVTQPPGSWLRRAASWTLISSRAGSCCDGAEMGSQIKPLDIEGITFKGDSDA